MVFVSRGDIHLGDHHKERDLKCHSYAEVLLCHAHHAATPRDHEHHVVGRVAGQGGDGGAQVLLVTSQVQQRDQLVSLLADLLCSRVTAVVHHGPRAVEAEDAMGDGARPPALDLVKVPEHVQPRPAPPIVELSTP